MMDNRIDTASVYVRQSSKFSLLERRIENACILSVLCFKLPQCFSHLNTYISEKNSNNFEMRIDFLKSIFKLITDKGAF